jgi:hypothetical protein
MFFVILFRQFYDFGIFVPITEAYLLITFLQNTCFDVPAPMAVYRWTAPQQFFPHIFAMNNHLSETSPTPIPCQTTFDILVHDIYNFGSSPPRTQESQDKSSSSEAESLG